MKIDRRRKDITCFLRPYCALIGILMTSQRYWRDVASLTQPGSFALSVITAMTMLFRAFSISNPGKLTLPVTERTTNRIQDNACNYSNCNPYNNFNARHQNMPIDLCNGCIRYNAECIGNRVCDGKRCLSCFTDVNFKPGFVL